MNHKELLYFAEVSGVDEKDAQDAVDMAMSFCAQCLADSPQVLDVLQAHIGITHSFALPFSESGEVYEFMGWCLCHTGFDLHDMIASIRYMPTIATCGISLEDLKARIAVAHGVGFGRKMEDVLEEIATLEKRKIMNQQEYRQEKKREEARKGLEMLGGCLAVFVLPITLLTLGLGIGWTVALAVAALFAVVIAVEKWYAG